MPGAVGSVQDWLARCQYTVTGCDSDAWCCGVSARLVGQVSVYCAQMRGALVSVLRLVGQVSVYCDWVRQQV